MIDLCEIMEFVTEEKNILHLDINLLLIGEVLLMKLLKNVRIQHRMWALFAVGLYCMSFLP